MNNEIGNVTINVDADGSGAIKTFQQITEEVRELGRSAKESELVDWLMAAEEAVEYNYKQLQKLDKGTAEYNATLQTLQDELEVVDNLTAQLKQVQGEVTEEFKASSVHIASFGEKLGNIAWNTFSAGAAAGVGALSALVSKGLKATDFLETSRVAMAGLTGSFEAGNEAMSIAANYWQNNPFQRIDVTNATKQLVQFGRSNNQLAKDLDILGNVSLSTGYNIADLARNYGRVASSGRAMTQDLEMMSDRGVPIYRELAKVTGQTQDQIRKMASEGKIDFQLFREAMEGAVNPEAIESYTQTLARQTDRLKGSIQILAGQLAGYKIVNDELVISEDGLEKAYTRLVEKLATGLRSEGLKNGLEKIGNVLAKIVDQISQWVEPALDKLSKVIDFIGEHTETLIPIVLGAGGALLKVASAIPGLNALAGPLASGFGKVTGVFKSLITKSPVLALVLGGIGIAFANLMKTDEEFQQNIKTLLSSLGTILKSILPAIQILAQAFVALFTSDLVLGGIKLIVGLVAQLADLLASIPQDVLAGIVIAILAIKVSSVAPWLMWIAAAGTVVQVLKDLVPNFMNAAKNAVLGFVNGIVDGTRQAVDAIKTFASGIVSNLKGALGIHSPSTITAEMGENLDLGLAEGITNNQSVVQRAMDNLAKDTFAKIDSVISNKVDFGLDIVGQYQEWKNVLKMFKEGSEQYKSAMEKMEGARKQANLRIVELQKNYNDTLDNTIDKIGSMFKTFQKVDLTGGMDSTQIIENLDQQVAQLGEWDAAQNVIASLNLDEGFKKELATLGVDSVNELSAIANMTTSELATLNDLWQKKQAVANKAAVREMEDLKEDTLDEISRLKQGIDGETVDVQEVGARLVSNIGDGITGAIPTLESAYAQLGEYMRKAAKELNSGGTSGTDNKNNKKDDDPTKDLKTTLDDTLADISKTFTERLPQVLLGAGIGAVLLKVVLPKIGQKLAGSGIGEAFGGILGKLFGGKEAVNAASQAAGIAQGTQGIGQSLGQTSTSLSQAPQWATNIQAGAKSVVAIAIAVAAVAGAIWVAHQALKDIDFGRFQLELIMLAETTVAFGALAWAAQTLGIGAGGLLVIAGIAADVALVGLGIRAAHELLAPVDFVDFQLKLVLMAEVVAAFGALATLLGMVAPLAGGGLLVIAGVAADVALVAASIGFADLALAPVDFDRFQPKLGLMLEVLAAFGGFSAVLGIVSGLVGLGWAATQAVIDEIKKTAVVLAMTNALIPNDYEKIIPKIVLVRDTIQFIADSNLGNLVKNISASWSVDPLLKVMGMYNQIAQALSELTFIVIDKGKAADNLVSAVETAQFLGQVSIPNTDWNGKEYAVGMASSIIWKLSELARAMNSVESTGTSAQTIQTLIDGLGGLVDGIVSTVSSKMAMVENLGVSIVDALKRGFDSRKDLMVSAGNELQGSLWQALQGKMHDEYEQGRAMANEFSNGLKSVSFENVGQSIQSAIWHEIQRRMDDEYQQGRSMGERFRQGLYDIDYANSGWWAVQGFINGAVNRSYSAGRDSVWWVGHDVAETFLKGLRAGGGEGSPWRTTYKSGNFAVEGLIEGLENSEDALIGKATTLAEKVAGALTMDDLSMTPSLDASYSVRGLPQMSLDESNASTSNRRGVVINQVNNNYTEYDIEQTRRDLAWSLSMV